MSLNASGWRVIASTVVGTGHTARGLECQDAHALEPVSTNGWVAAIADGAGSARRSAEGAKIAVAEAVKYLAARAMQQPELDESGWKGALLDCVHEARTAIEKLASENANGTTNSLPDLATTLLIICVTENWICALQLGDGAIITRSTSGSLDLIFKPSRGEYINETNFITETDFAGHVQVRIQPAADIEAIAVLTDGIEILALSYANGSPHGPFFGPMFTFASSPDGTDAGLEAFLKSEKVCERTDDDKTLLLAVRR
jgi:hypothetical protein